MTHLLLVDNYDSFTYNLADYFRQLDCRLTIVRNNELPLEKVLDIPFDAIVLSPGPKRPADAGWMMDLIARMYQHVPILGICLGHQALGEFFGARLVRAPEPVHGKTAWIRHGEKGLYDRLTNPLRVMRYHSLVLEDLAGTDLEITSETDRGEVMSIRHRKFPCVGVQFHPESVLTEQGIAILDNWLIGVEAALV